MMLPPLALPTEAEESLLRVLVDSDPAQARHQWSRWIARVDIDLLDAASARLLPLLPARLKELDIDSPELQRLRGIHRRSHYANTLLFSRSGRGIRLLAAAGIPVLALKGAPLALRYYRDAGQRFMADVDLLVPHEAARRATGLLLADGWKTPAFSRPWSPSRIAAYHADSFDDGNGAAIDLHWWGMIESIGSDVDAEFWAGAEEGVIGGATCRFICPTDLLLQVLLHGTRGEADRPIRWIVDALTIIRSGRTIDWQRLARLAERLQTSHIAAAALAWLRDTFAAEIPEDAITRLASRPMSAFERRQYRVYGLPVSLLRSFRFLHLVHLRASGQTQLPFWRRRPLGFAAYLRDYFMLEKIRQLPRLIIGKGMSRLKRRTDEFAA